MYRESLGNKQAIIAHNFLIQNKRHDPLITRHRQKIRYQKNKQEKKEL